MSLLRFLGLGGDTAEARRESRETDTVRRIAAELEKKDPAEAKFLATFAYVLARVAHADLHIDETETDAMLGILEEVGALQRPEAALVVEIAKSQARLLGGTENYVVTREFRRTAEREQRARLLRCLYAVAAADGSISATETGEITAIAAELGFTRQEANALRAEFRDKLGVFQKRD